MQIAENVSSLHTDDWLVYSAVCGTAELQKKFGDHYLYAGLGTTLDLGANPHVASDQRAIGVLDESELRNYGTLLAQSDDLSDGGLEIVHLAQTR